MTQEIITINKNDIICKKLFITLFIIIITVFIIVSFLKLFKIYWIVIYVIKFILM